ncbi:MAG: CDP-diacylglycerol diphosphatase, partial [Caulobacteraceae bacterium]|nr:CDP-diacylglycerol diphosphatase [Caulobacteraceae bacterium]
MKFMTSAAVAALLLVSSLDVSTRAARHAGLSRLVERSAAGHPNALWHIVHDLCVTDMKTRGGPAPCSVVDLSGGYAVLKDIRGATQLLVIPTDRVTGVESPALLAPGAPNYFEDAWRARDLFEKRVGRAVPRVDIGLAVNSMYGRSQNQLHIHVDCVRPDVRAALAANIGRIGPRWRRLGVPLAGHDYLARRLDGDDLGANNPFKLLAGADRRTRADMGAETLAVIAVVTSHGGPGFVLLA